MMVTDNENDTRRFRVFIAFVTTVTNLGAEEEPAWEKRQLQNKFPGLSTPDPRPASLPASLLYVGIFSSHSHSPLPSLSGAHLPHNYYSVHIVAHTQLFPPFG